ncbi:MAG TPA: right-handed parallel beta-helix repeat-containing protein [Blastocatellia bacterium]
MIKYALGTSLLAVFFVGAAMAQSARTFVSGQGKDKGSCSQTAPCRTFTQAISQTSAGGAVVALDSATYTPFTVTKALTVEAPLGAAVTVSSGDGVDIDAGANDTVILRGLTINNQGSSGNGIVLNTAATLHIEHCVVNAFAEFGMSGIAVAGPASVFVKDTIARDNYNGVSVTMGSAAGVTATLTLERVHLDANRIGLSIVTEAGQLVNGAVQSSSASGNGAAGFLINADAGGTISMNIDNCLLTNSGIGLVVESSNTSTAAAYIAFCTLSHNTVNGFDIGGTGAVFSRGNNTLSDNGPNQGSLTALASQ